MYSRPKRASAKIPSATREILMKVRSAKAMANPMKKPKPIWKMAGERTEESGSSGMGWESRGVDEGSVGSRPVA